MKLFVTAPLSLESRVVVEKLKEVSPSVQALLMTHEFCRVHGQSVKQLIQPELCQEFFLEPSEFGECAPQVRLLEMLCQCDAVMVFKPKDIQNSTMIPEPGVKMSSLADAVEKNRIVLTIVEF